MLNITQICTCILLCKFIYECYNNPRLYIDKFNHFIYKFIKYYSKCEMIYNKYLFPYIKKIYFYFNNIDQYTKIEFYSNGILVNKDLINTNKDISSLKQELEPEKYDLIICSHHDKQIHKICYNLFPQTFQYDISNIRFLSLTLIFKDKYFEIVLSDSKYNFYIVNNIIDNLFLLYYIRVNFKYNDIINIDDFKYKLVFMDNNVKIHNLNETDQIIIMQSNYIISKKIKEEKIEEELFIIT